MPGGKGNIGPKDGKPFTKGDPRINRKGAPKLPDLKEAIAKVLGKEQNGKTALDEILETLHRQAKNGNTKAAEILMDRGFGKAMQPTDITTQGKEIGFTKLTDEELDGKISELMQKFKGK